MLAEATKSLLSSLDKIQNCLQGRQCFFHTRNFGKYSNDLYSSSSREIYS